MRKEAREISESVYEEARKAAQEKWKGFRKNFKEMKSKMNAEFMKARTPKDLIAFGKKIQEMGELLRIERERVENEEEGEEDEKYEVDKQEMIDANNDEFEEKINAEIAKKAKLSAENDAIKASELVEKIKSGDLGGEDKEDSQANLIEKIGAPEGEMFEKYGSEMRKTANELVEVVRKRSDNDKKMENSEYKSEEWKKLWGEHLSLNKKRNDLLDKLIVGKGVLVYRFQENNEDNLSYAKYQDRERNEFKKTAYDDPYVVLRLIESGQLYYEQGDDWGRLSDRLRSNPEFVEQAINLIKKRNNARGDSSWFWQSIVGEAKKNRKLFIEAVKLNHLNYQFGSKEFKSDPEIQKIALESGLDEVYLSN